MPGGKRKRCSTTEYEEPPKLVASGHQHNHQQHPMTGCWPPTNENIENHVRAAWIEQVSSSGGGHFGGHGGMQPPLPPPPFCQPPNGSYLMNLVNPSAGFQQKNGGSMSEESFRNIYTPLLLGSSQSPYLPQLPPYYSAGQAGQAAVNYHHHHQQQQHFAKHSKSGGELNPQMTVVQPQHQQAQQATAPKPTRQLARRSTIHHGSRTTSAAVKQPTSSNLTNYETTFNNQQHQQLHQQQLQHQVLPHQQQQQASFASIYASQTWLNPELVLQQQPTANQTPHFYFTDRRMSTGYPVTASTQQTNESQGAAAACTLKRSMTTVRRRGRPPKNAAALVAAAAQKPTAAELRQETSHQQTANSTSTTTTAAAAITSSSSVKPAEQPTAIVDHHQHQHQPTTNSNQNLKENASSSSSSSQQPASTVSSSSPAAVVKKTMSKRTAKSIFAKCSSTSNLQRNKVSTSTAAAAESVKPPTQCTFSSSNSKETTASGGSNGQQQPPAKTLKSSQPPPIDAMLPSSMLTPYQSNNNLLVLSDVLNIMNNTNANASSTEAQQKHRQDAATESKPTVAKQQLVDDSDDDSTSTSSLATPMPQLTWANNNELWQAMLKKDAKYVHDPFYLKRHIGIESQMRAILLDWLVEICYAYKLHRETFHLACEYMDRFMSCAKQQMKVDRLQLIGMTSLFLAAKVEEIYPPKLKELASHMESYSSNNEEAISQFELFMLKTLNWEISPVTANTWLMTYLHIAALNSFFITNDSGSGKNATVHNAHVVMPLHVERHRQRTHSLAHPATVSQTVQMLRNASTAQQQFYLQNYMKCVTLLDLCMFDMESLKFSYSMLAAAAVYHMVSKPTLPAGVVDMSNLPNDHMTLVTNLVQKCTGYRVKELDQCIKWMHPYAETCLEKISQEKLVKINYFGNVDADDAHNIQLYYQNLELLKEAQCRKSPTKLSYASLKLPMTPPESSSSSVGHTSLLSTSTTSLANYN